MGTYLVTGSSTGIGRAVTRALDMAGHTVWAGVRSQADADALAAEGTPALRPVLLEVTDEARVREVVAGIGEVAPLDGIVNNAGIAVGGPVEYVALEQWRWQLEVNVIAQVAVTQAALQQLRQTRGRVVFIGSMAGRIGSQMLGPYTASKHAIEGIAWALRQEVRPFGIEVAVVEPGAIRTEIWAKARSQADEIEAAVPEEGRSLYRAHIARVREGIDKQDRVAVDPSAVVEAVSHALFATRPRARYPVGMDARVAIGLSRFLPPKLMDRIIAAAS